MLDISTLRESSQVIIDIAKEMSGDSRFASFAGEVTAIVNDAVVVNQEYIDIRLNNNPNFSTIDIMWEDFGYKNYKSMGLFGRMTTQYQRVEKTDESQFTIIDTKFKIVVNY